MSTKKCSKCKMEIDRKATKCPYCGSSQGMSCSGMLGALVFIVVIVGVLGAIGNSRNSDTKKPTTSVSVTTASTTSVPSDTQSETSESTDEESDIVWYSKKLGLYQSTVGTKGVHDEFGYMTIYGGVGNASGRNYQFIEIEFSIYDNNGNKTGDAIDTVSGLDNGECWRYEAFGYGGAGTKYKFKSITAY